MRSTRHSSAAMMAADVLRLLVDFLLIGIALLAAGAAFVWLWGFGTDLARVLAFPAAFVGLVLGFYVSVLLLRLAFLRRVRPGRYRLTDRAALRWIVWDSFMRMYHRHPLHRYIDDFGPVRYVFYRLLGAQVDSTFFFGWQAMVLDPWGLRVGRDVVIGSFAVISCHSVEGDTVVLEPVEIGDGATIGVRSLVLPGVQIGDGAIVGAGAVVTKGTRVPAGEVWAGVPARKIGMVRDAAVEEPEEAEA